MVNNIIQVTCLSNDYCWLRCETLAERKNNRKIALNSNLMVMPLDVSVIYKYSLRIMALSNIAIFKKETQIEPKGRPSLKHAPGCFPAMM